MNNVKEVPSTLSTVLRETSHTLDRLYGLANELKSKRELIGGSRPMVSAGSEKEIMTPVALYDIAKSNLDRADMLGEFLNQEIKELENLLG